MLLSSLLLFAAAPFQADAEPPAREPVGAVTVYRLGTVDNFDGDAKKNLSLLIRDGVIERMGQALVIPAGAKVIDLRRSGQVATPPLVLSHAPWLVSDRRGGGNNSRFLAADSLHLEQDWAEDFLKEGVMLVGVDAPGSGFPGRSSVLRAGAGLADGPLVADLHLKLTMSGTRSGKKLVRDAFKGADDAIAKEKKAEQDWKAAREAWEAKQKEKAEAEKEKGKEEQGKGAAAAQDPEQEKGKGEEEKEPPKEFTPPEMNPNIAPIVDWVRKERVAQLWLGSAADWLHWRDLEGERELPYQLVLRHSRSQNFGEVVDALAATGLTIDLPAVISFLPFTRVQANLPAELAAAGVEKLILSPASDSLDGLRSWRTGVARCVAEGLDRDTALRGMSLAAAAAIGQEEVVAPLAIGAAANFVIWSGDPLDSMSQVDFVIADGKVIYDRKKKEKEEAR